MSTTKNVDNDRMVIVTIVPLTQTKSNLQQSESIHSFFHRPLHNIQQIEENNPVAECFQGEIFTPAINNAYGVRHVNDASSHQQLELQQLLSQPSRYNNYNDGINTTTSSLMASSPYNITSNIFDCTATKISPSQQLLRQQHLQTIATPGYYINNSSNCVLGGVYKLIVYFH